MVKKRTIYTASDGKEFDNEKEAEEHDKKVIRESIKVYKVYYNPDLNEGRGYGDYMDMCMFMRISITNSF